MPRVEVSTLDHILALSNERQALWSIAHVRKFSYDWRLRHDRIEAISKQLHRLWHMHRLELADHPDRRSSVMDRIGSDHFEDYRARVGVDPDGIWRIEDETYHERHYMTVGQGIQDNAYANGLKNPTKERSSRPNVGARQRRKQQLSAHSML
ncbi:MAG: hypothetical protein H0X30_01305 [Anaerolineae bacterium]|nr:hypothetical protein [Anaerolineae bacterium]